jgi:hypothetical protein
MLEVIGHRSLEDGTGFRLAPFGELKDFAACVFSAAR